MRYRLLPALAFASSCLALLPASSDNDTSILENNDEYLPIQNLAVFADVNFDDLESLAADKGVDTLSLMADPNIQLFAAGIAAASWQPPPINTRITQATYHQGINMTELEWVAQCLADWCETDKFLVGRHGKIRCYTDPDRESGGVVAFACNGGKPARCSRRQIRAALFHNWRMSRLWTGWSWLDLGHGMDLLLGFDTFCDGNLACGEPSDPVVAACDANSDGYRFQGQPLQFERRVHSGMYGDREPGPYAGITWVNKPTATPIRPSASFPKITKTPKAHLKSQKAQEAAAGR
ncbi:hypothetical protein QBC47DRAFT_403748 [Echria macrotheca]|uniref:Uncharacterized protein n=1 Tax=Echria macrotheca TaxID=438768 RepID=A0AAJ0B8G0_9PEZI|nr:hypothetical protein QBC47DRAFT_403748 [Echria macrotheca]